MKPSAHLSSQRRTPATPCIDPVVGDILSAGGTTSPDFRRRCAPTMKTICRSVITAARSSGCTARGCAADLGKFVVHSGVPAGRGGDAPGRGADPSWRAACASAAYGGVSVVGGGRDHRSAGVVAAVGSGAIATPLPGFLGTLCRADCRPIFWSASRRIASQRTQPNLWPWTVLPPLRRGTHLA